jgi:hypothetical protein
MSSGKDLVLVRFLTAKVQNLRIVKKNHQTFSQKT